MTLAKSTRKSRKQRRRHKQREQLPLHWRTKYQRTRELILLLKEPIHGLERLQVEDALKTCRWLDGWGLIGSVILLRAAGKLVPSGKTPQETHVEKLWRCAGAAIAEGEPVEGIRLARQGLFLRPPVTSDGKLVQVQVLAVIHLLTTDQTNSATPALWRLWTQSLSDAQ